MIGVLLAGGRSQRFGQPKAFAQFEGKCFWEHSIDAMKEVTNKQIIISHPDIVHFFEETSRNEILMDDIHVRGKGPLAGIYTAMKYEKTEWYMILSCDIPLINKKIIRCLVDAREQGTLAIIPKINNRIHPLVGVYHYSTFEYIDEALQKERYRMMSLLEKINVKYLSDNFILANQDAFCNINSQEDYIALQNSDTIKEL
ncbi:molybdenum cofactor guanylyltransferase [Metabacillus sp. 22489]|uniref:molybdenum cofactor guanylyltransferase n=1 Tax=Metabacillus sp. 22489 TaxID=3453928 RepID=UPI003F87965D